MITTSLPPAHQAARPPNVESYDNSGPWRRIDTIHNGGDVYRSLCVNLPCSLLRVWTPDQPLPSLRQLLAPDGRPTDERRLAVTALLSLLAGKTAGSKAVVRRGVYTQSLHTRDSYTTYPHGTALPSYVFTVELLVRYQTTEDGERVAKPVGLRAWKHATSPDYSDSLLFDRQRWVVTLERASRKRGRDALSSGPQIASLADLHRVYQGVYRGAPPLVGSWDALFKKARTPPFSGNLYARSAPNELHALAPELLLDPRNNPLALTAGLDAVGPLQSDPTKYGTSPLVLGPPGCPHYVLDPGADPLGAPLPRHLLRQLPKPTRKASRSHA